MADTRIQLNRARDSLRELGANTRLSTPLYSTCTCRRIRANRHGFRGQCTADRDHAGGARKAERIWRSTQHMVGLHVEIAAMHLDHIRNAEPARQPARGSGIGIGPADSSNRIGLRADGAALPPAAKQPAHRMKRAAEAWQIHEDKMIRYAMAGHLHLAAHTAKRSRKSTAVSTSTSWHCPRRSNCWRLKVPRNRSQGVGNN